MSCVFSGVLQPPCLTEEASLHAIKFSTSQQVDVRWANGESRIAELLSCIQPNGQSELRRKAVADYVSGLVQKCLDCEVFRFGSVPLKTYLPDGDIDLTVFSSHQELRDSWALDVQAALEHETQRKDADFAVSNVQSIHAEVKIVKCVVENVVVDISFNQLGGLCTLCFLEEVDRLIQKNHLFKQSIILVKAWCFYESRILGAHHALISTYALETLVLYIFNVFHATLRGPLEVLFTFLDYFSKFDWEKYCISLWGPVPLAALPDLTAEPPLKEGSKLLLSKGFLEACSALYDVCPKGGDAQARLFSGKYLNIVDPLRINNNLGRSVSQANFYRIKKAFRLGAYQLANLFEVVDEEFPKCLDEFFSNTWERLQSGYRPDAPTSIFIPYKKFVDETRCSDMLGIAGAEFSLASPELGRSSLLFAENITENDNSSSHFSDSRILMEDIKMETAGGKSGGGICWHGSRFLKDCPATKENLVHGGHNGNTDLTRSVGDVVSKTSANMQSTLLCTMPLAASTDSQLRTSSSRKISLDKGHHTEACKSPASLNLSNSESGHKKRLNIDMIIDSCSSPKFLQQVEFEESPHKKDSQGFCSPTKGGQGVWRLNARKSSGHSDVFMKKAASDTFAIVHGQGTCNTDLVRGKSWPIFNPHESNKISTAIDATSDSMRTPTSALENLMTSNTAMQKPPNFLFPEPRDLHYMPPMAPYSSPSVSSSSSFVVASSPSPHPSSSSVLEKVEDLACASHAEAKPCEELIPTSQDPALKDVQSFSSPMSPHHELTISRTPSQHQLFASHQQQFQFSQQPEQAWLQSNVDIGTYVFSPSNQSAALTKENKCIDGSNVMGGASVNRHRPIPSEGKGFSNTKNEKMQLPIQGYFDAHHFPKSKANLHKGTETATCSLPVVAAAVDINQEACYYSGAPHLSDNTATAAFSCENLPVSAPYFQYVLPTTGIVSKATIPSFNEGLSTVRAVGQQPFNLVDTFQSTLFGTKASSGHEGGKYLAQGCTPTASVPVVSYHNPFYPAFPFHSVGPHIPYQHRAFQNGVPMLNLPHNYHGSGQIPESTAAALSARFASLSSEESGAERPSDLLRSDLANHLRNLEFGRWCQERVLHSSAEPPPLMYHGGQDSHLWGGAALTPVYGYSNQIIGTSNGPVPPVLIVPQDVRAMSPFPSSSGTADSGLLPKQESGTGTFLPMGNGMCIYRKLPGSETILQHDQGPAQKRTHFSSTNHMSTALTFVPSALHGVAYNAATNVHTFTNIEGGEQAHVSSHLESKGRVLPLAAGQLEFGSLGPIDIMSFPCNDLGTKKANRISTGRTSSDCFPPIFETHRSNVRHSGGTS